MKKYISVMLVASACTLFVSGCGASSKQAAEENSQVKQQEPVSTQTSVAAPIQSPTSTSDVNSEKNKSMINGRDEDSGKLIDIKFVGSGMGWNSGELTIIFSENGQTKEKKLNDIYDPRAIDVNNDGSKEIIMSQIFDVGGSNADMVAWDNVYIFDTSKEELILESDKYPDYYKNIFIPELKSYISSASSNLNKQGNQVLIQVANELVNGTFVPDKSGEKIKSRLISPNEKALERFKTAFNDRMRSKDSNLLLTDFVKEIKKDVNTTSYLYKVSSNIEMIVSFDQGATKAIFINENNKINLVPSPQVIRTWSSAIETINADVSFDEVMQGFKNNMRIKSDQSVESTYTKGSFVYSNSGGNKSDQYLVRAWQHDHQVG